MIRSIYFNSIVCLALFAAPVVAQFAGGGGGGGLAGGGGGLGGGGGGGVYLDAEGVIRALKKKSKSSLKPKAPALKEEIAKRSDLRQVSLKNIDAELRKHFAAGGAAADLAEEIRGVAGLYRVDYILLDRANKDVLLCGPAEGWVRDIDGRAIGKTSKRPALDVSDVAVAFRCVLAGSGEIKCSIDPQKSGLAKALNYEVPTITGEKTQAEQVRAEIEDRLGMQVVTTGGVPAGSRFARAIVDADYRMKRIAMGFDRVPGLYTHLDAVAEIIATGANKTTLARWWFTPAYEGVECDADETTFRLLGPGMKLLNEEVLVDDSGNRTGTGRSGAKWDRFSHAFTQMLPQLEKSHTAFADLHNLYDLAMVAGIVKKQGCGDWFRDSVFMDEKQFAVPTELQPKFTEPVVTARFTKRNRAGDQQIYLGIALGGVSMNPSSVLSAAGFVHSGAGSTSPNTSSGRSSSSGAITGSGGSSGTTSIISKVGVPVKEIAPLKPVSRAISGDAWWSDASTTKE